jgi:predicted helicase
MTEGVDVPAVDVVAFLSPRKSKVDIVQAAGRAMRTAPDKQTGYVLLPLFLETQENETIEGALEQPTLKKPGMSCRQCRSRMRCLQKSSARFVRKEDVREVLTIVAAREGRGSRARNFP